jgi:hypothetical protein
MRSAAFVLLALAAPAFAAEPTITTDPRVELLGVVQWLSGERPDLPADEFFAAEVKKRFAPFAGHPAVARYREAARKHGSSDGTGIDILYYGAPPELARRATRDAPPYLQDPDDSARFDALLTDLRDFAKKSKFSDFYAEHRKDYARVAAAAAAEYGTSDPTAVLEKYVGMPLDSRARWYVSPLYVPSHRNAYISPYPDPRTSPDPGPEPFEVTTLVAYVTGQGPAGEVVTQRHRAALWQEPLFVLMDPALRAFDAARGGDLAGYYGAAVAECRGNNGPDCAENWIIAALCARLDVAAFGATTNMPDGRDPRREAYAAALAARLEEYEGDRKRWPTLWDFFPRLMSVFPEKAGLKAPPAPKLPKLRSVKDLFPGPAKAGTSK